MNLNSEQMIEVLAMHLYNRSGTCERVAWSNLSKDCQQAWLKEAQDVLSITQLTEPEEKQNIIIPATIVDVEPNKLMPNQNTLNVIEFNIKQYYYLPTNLPQVQWKTDSFLKAIRDVDLATFRKDPTIVIGKQVNVRISLESFEGTDRIRIRDVVS